MKLTAKIKNELFDILIDEKLLNNYLIKINKKEYIVKILYKFNNYLVLSINNKINKVIFLNIKKRDLKILINNQYLDLIIDNAFYFKLEHILSISNKDEKNQLTCIKAPMNGCISRIVVKSGDKVKKGQILIYLEAMKMENEIHADIDGVIIDIKTNVNATVSANDILLLIKN